MSNRLLIYLSLLVVAGILLLMLLNTLMGTSDQYTYLHPNQVRGMEVVHNGKPYTLNFTQQQAVIRYLNLSSKVNKTDYHSQEEFPFSEIKIYQFGKPDIVIKPFAMRDTNIVYVNKEWNPQGYLLEMSGGQLRNLLTATYDP